MPKVVTPACVYSIWLADFLKMIGANSDDAEQLKNALVTLIKNMDCEKKTSIWNTQWSCLTDEEKSVIFQELVDAYGKDKLAVLFNDFWDTLTNDQLNHIGKLLKGRVVPAVCKTGGLEVVVTCESEDQDIKLYCLRVKISTDADNTLAIGSDGGLSAPLTSTCDSDITGKVLSFTKDAQGKPCATFKVSKNKDNLVDIVDDGILVVAPAGKTTSVYIRSDIGTDTVVDKNGDTVGRAFSSPEEPFKNFENAVLSTPNGSVVNVYLYYQSTFNQTSDGAQLEHTSTVSPGYFDFGNRNITIFPYGNTYQESKLKEYESKYYDGGMSYALANIQRPKLLINWTLVDNGTGNKVVSFRGLKGASGASTIQFLGVDLEIIDVDLLNTTYKDYSLTTGWFWSGSNITFKCTKFGKLPTSPKHYLLGAGGSSITTYTFGYVNYFEDGADANVQLFYQPDQTSITFAVSADTTGNGAFGDTNDPVIPNNTNAFLSRDVVFYNGIEIIKVPTAQYKDLRVNKEMQFIKYPERLTAVGL